MYICIYIYIMHTSSVVVVSTKYEATGAFVRFASHDDILSICVQARNP